MADIFHHFIIHAPPGKVFNGISTPEGLDKWWTKSSDGISELGKNYTLKFGPNYIWSATVTKCMKNREFELTIDKADEDWINTKVGFSLALNNETTEVDFYHTGWPQKNEHYKISCYCWAMYLRILKRFLEHKEEVPYEDRLEV